MIVCALQHSCDEFKEMDFAGLEHVLKAKMHCLAVVAIGEKLWNTQHE